MKTLYPLLNITNIEPRDHHSGLQHWDHMHAPHNAALCSVDHHSQVAAMWLGLQMEGNSLVDDLAIIATGSKELVRANLSVVAQA
eukprot:2009227-Amphidinium_carterae.1